MKRNYKIAIRDNKRYGATVTIDLERENLINEDGIIDEIGARDIAAGLLMNFHSGLYSYPMPAVNDFWEKNTAFQITEFEEIEKE